jgi:methylmalonyl-CoA carboxyltransferase 12S subunit
MELTIDDNAALIDSIKALRDEVARLSQRVAALEKRPSAEPPPPVERPPAKTKPEVSDGLSEETVMVISAAIAAYLGVKPHLRQIRLINNNPWGLQGRVTIQASHALETHHG